MRRTNRSKNLRSRLLRRGHLLPHALLHPERARLPARHLPVLRRDIRRIQRPHRVRRLPDRQPARLRVAVAIHYRGRNDFSLRHRGLFLAPREAADGLVLERGRKERRHGPAAAE